MTILIILGLIFIFVVTLAFIIYSHRLFTKDKKYVGQFYIKSKSGHTLTIQITGPTPQETANLTNHIKDLIRTYPKLMFDTEAFDEVMDSFDHTMDKLKDVFKTKRKYEF